MRALTRSLATSSLIAMLLCAAFLADLVRAEDAMGQNAPSAIEEKIERHKQRMEEGKESLSELSQRKRELYTGLARLKDRIEKLTSRLREQEKNLRAKRREEKELQTRNKKLMRRISREKQAIRNMIPRMWPLYLKNKELGPGDVAGLEHVRRNYAWLASVYRMVRERLASLNAEQSKLSSNLSRLRRVEQNISERLAEIEDSKDQLLEQKLAYMDRIQKVRKEQLAKREQLERVRETINNLRYRLKNSKKRNMAQLKGRLTWPARGEMVSSQGGESESSKGLVFSLEKGQKVRSVAWGKVVYNDKLRGFGRVVIILHSQDYYSLYAYLLASQVEMGQRIEKGETIGRAGFHPQLDGPGLYFELRQGQQPIDPRPWLAKRSDRG
ncbi:MAG: peptidoglycan DD-metalloendopeptidase family protein [Desulfohalobiaceae bacterium]|nr:peptidoglycan DD-metalloendopeptidase family protein [Desulfohalobiaceae bacterium]